MFCPTCGAEDQGKVKFCRRCGANLSAVLDVIHHGATSVAEPSPDSVTKERLVRMLMKKIEEANPAAQSMWGEPILPKLVKQLERLTITPEERREKYFRRGMVVTGVGLGFTAFLYLVCQALAAAPFIPDAIAPIVRVMWAKGLVPLFIGLMMMLYGLFYGRATGRSRRKLIQAELQPDNAANEPLLERHIPFGSVTEQTTTRMELPEREAPQGSVQRRPMAER